MHQTPPSRFGSRRSRLRATIAILCVLVAIGVAVVAGIEFYKARVRGRILDQYRGQPGFRVIMKSAQVDSPRSLKLAEVNWLRRTFGDGAVVLILIPHRDATAEELSRIRAAFPEAVVAPSPLSKP